jgi:hypothetical protein
MSAEQHAAEPDPVGDPVCWLHELCPECGALPTLETPDRCWRCGTPIVTTQDDEPPGPAGRPRGTHD